MQVKVPATIHSAAYANYVRACRPELTICNDNLENVKAFHHFLGVTKVQDNRFWRTRVLKVNKTVARRAEMLAGENGYVILMVHMARTGSSKNGSCT